MTIKRLLTVSVWLGLILGCGRNESEKQAPAGGPPAQTQAPAPASSGYEAIQVADGGTITGTISVSGAVPKLPSRQLNKDPSVCGTGARESQQLIVNKGGGLK